MIKKKKIIFLVHSCALVCLTHLSIASFYGTLTNSVDPDQTPLNAASNQLLHSLFTKCAFMI